jgi:hypothetical protein
VASQQMILFYNARTRAGATARIDDAGVLQPLHEIPADDLELWTHLASDGRFVLFYNADSRTGATARIDDAGVLGDQQPLTADYGPWTHLVA